MWTAIAFWFCAVWGVLLVALMLRDVVKADLVGFLVKGVEGAAMLITCLVLSGVLS